MVVTSATPPESPTIYHIVHVDRLESIVRQGYLWSDFEVSRQTITGTMIGLPGLKQRRAAKRLRSHPDLHVGDCVPFYFCPRSVMLYVIYRREHPELAYHDGQDPIVHLQANCRKTAKWADNNGLRWAFTLKNAGTGDCEDRRRMEDLRDLDWNAIDASAWRDPEVKSAKQAEFLVEAQVPWFLIDRIGVRTRKNTGDGGCGPARRGAFAGNRSQDGLVLLMVAGIC